MISNNIAKTIAIIVMLGLIPIAGCQEVKTIKREMENKLKQKWTKSKKPFEPRDGITVRECNLHQTANQNSEVVHKLPAETQIHLVDRIGEWYRARTRDGREGYLDHKVVGGEEVIAMTRELRKSIEGIPPQAEGVTKSKANFRFEPGRQYPVVEELPAGKKFEMYERVVTARPAQKTGRVHRPQGSHPDGPSPAGSSGAPADPTDDSSKKDVWYKVKIDDGRVGYVYTHNLRPTPNQEIVRELGHLRIVAWRPVGATDDPDTGAQNNYVVACVPKGKDPGCDYTGLYFLSWSTKAKKMVTGWPQKVSGVLPITNFQFEGRPGFSMRQLHPNKRDKLILTHFVHSGGKIRKVSEEEISIPKKPDPPRDSTDEASRRTGAMRGSDENPQLPDRPEHDEE
ncbi:MAG: SH3 domain-containing protein [Thermodesulfobacteriota bacterium]